MSDHPLKRLLQKITGQDREAVAMRESLEEVIEESDRESPALSAQERVMLGNLLRFGELKVSDVMVPLSVAFVVGWLVLTRRRAVSPAFGRLAALFVGTMLVAGPYMALIGGISNKTSADALLKRLLGENAADAFDKFRRRLFQPIEQPRQRTRFVRFLANAPDHAATPINRTAAGAPST